VYTFLLLLYVIELNVTLSEFKKKLFQSKYQMVYYYTKVFIYFSSWFLDLCIIHISTVTMSQS